MAIQLEERLNGLAISEGTFFAALLNKPCLGKVNEQRREHVSTKLGVGRRHFQLLSPQTLG